MIINNEQSNDTNSVKNENGNQVNQNFSIKFYEKEREVDKFIRGYALECEICGYLRNKICSIECNKELPDVFYSLRDVKINDKKEKSYFYNEFDSVFYLSHNFEFKKNLFRINFK